MANALVVREIQLPKSVMAARAAQYVRVSTDYQRYSIENQAVAIAAYAARHGLSIVHTYRDEGESGLRIKNRKGLRELIDDVRAGRADFTHLLVYDVSRWGRFQDTDESAHYEFICKQAGVKVTYCAEQFDNDGSLLSSIVKNLKRVMAAEYSRELSVKVHAGACRIASLGFRSGAAPGYGLRRELVDESGQSRGSLDRGLRKHLQTDHVILRPGPKHELKIVRWIFRQFVTKRYSQAWIVRELNRRQVPNHRGARWSHGMVNYILRNENYIGNILYNRMTFRLRQFRRKNAADLWIRSKAGFDPIVPERIFAKAQIIIKQHYVRRSDEELLERLREAFREKGQRLSGTVMNRMPELPSTSLYVWRFGSLRNAFRLIGHRSPRNCEYIDSRPALTKGLLEQAHDITRRVRALGASATFDTATHTLSVDRLAVSFRIARYNPAYDQVAVWNVNRRKHLPHGLILALRLDNENRRITDYFLMPTTEMKKHRIALRETLRHSRFDKYRVTTMQGVVRNIMEAVATRRALPEPRATSRPLTRRRRRGQTARAPR